MSLKLKVDFYRIETSVGIDFQRILSGVNALTPEERNRSGTGSPIRLQEISFNGDVIEGDMLRIRMDEVPLRASLRGDTRFIDLNDDEGIGEETAFYYYIPWRVLLLQRNRYALSASAFAWYFNHISENGMIVMLNQILRSDVMQRLARMTIIRKFKVNIAGIDNASIFRNQGQGVNAIIDLKEQFSSPNVNISLSMAKRRGSLLVEMVRETIHDLLGISGHNDRQVKKLAVLAQEDYTSVPEPLDSLRRVVADLTPDFSRAIGWRNDL
jgi:hypothetical protein